MPRVAIEVRDRLVDAVGHQQQVEVAGVNRLLHDHALEKLHQRPPVRGAYEDDRELPDLSGLDERQGFEEFVHRAEATRQRDERVGVLEEKHLPHEEPPARDPAIQVRVRRLLDRQLERAGIPTRRVTGYGNEARSHLDVARLVAAGVADVGIGVRAAAKIHGVDFISLERERYDLIIPRIYYELPTLAVLLDTIVGQPFRSEIEAMGGELHVTAKFPNRPAVEIVGVGETG